MTHVVDAIPEESVVDVALLVRHEYRPPEARQDHGPGRGALVDSHPGAGGCGTIPAVSYANTPVLVGVYLGIARTDDGRHVEPALDRNGCRERRRIRRTSRESG